MKQRFRTGPKPAKARQRKAAALKRRNAPTAVPRPSAASKDVEGLKRDLREALEQQAATSEVLNAISSSTGDLEPVFAAILTNATRICAANFGVLTLYESGQFRVAAVHNVPPEFSQERGRERLFRPTVHHPLSRVARTKQVVHIRDLRKDKSYYAGDPATVSIVDNGGARTIVDVPMLKDGALIGIIGIYRQHVRSFTEKQIALLKNFANQAVIAIENTRLLNELRESLQQQTATADVLRAINSSAGELDPVFQVMLEEATRLCAAEFGNLFLFDGEAFRTAALYQASQAYSEARQRPFLVRDLHPDVPLMRIVQVKEVIHVADVRTERSYIEGDPEFSKLVEVAGARTLLLVPLLRETSVRRGVRHLSQGGPSFYRQADRVGTELRRTGRCCH